MPDSNEDLYKIIGTGAPGLTTPLPDGTIVLTDSDKGHLTATYFPESSGSGTSTTDEITSGCDRRYRR